VRAANAASLASRGAAGAARYTRAVALANGSPVNADALPPARPSLRYYIELGML